MSNTSASVTEPPTSSQSLVEILLTILPQQRGAALHAALFGRCADADVSANGTSLHSAFDEYWVALRKRKAPMRAIATLLAPPMPVKAVMAFNRLTFVNDKDDVNAALRELVRFLEAAARVADAPTQLALLSDLADADIQAATPRPSIGGSTNDLHQLVADGQKYATIYADPPWPYENEASRAAAVNHYPVMSIEDICDEPVRELVKPESHLHLWTTNAFLREAFVVLNAWGFEFKSCLVWIKHEMGMGNYWRVSHEFLLLGVRGRLTFRDRTLPSWVQAHRTLHSRKPGLVRELVEKVSPGPYLELYGREELPNSAWTVYGNQVEKRFF